MMAVMIVMKLLMNQISLRYQKDQKRLGKESFEMMELVTTMCDCCVVEKSYVLIGGEESEQLLQLRSLQHLVDIEREVRCLFRITIDLLL